MIASAQSSDMSWNTICFSRGSTVDTPLQSLLVELEQNIRARPEAMHPPLRPPARTIDLDAIEATLGFALLPDVKHLYQWHDGSEARSDSFQIAEGFIFLPLAGATAEWEMLNSLVAEMFSSPREGDWYFKSVWLPIGSSFAGSRLVVDHESGIHQGSVFPIEHGNGARRDKAWPNIRAVLEELM